MDAWGKLVFTGAMGLIRNAGYAVAAVPGVSRRGDGHDRGVARSLTPHFTTTASFPGLYVDVHLFVAWSSHIYRGATGSPIPNPFAAIRTARAAGLCRAYPCSCIGERLPNLKRLWPFTESCLSDGENSLFRGLNISNGVGRSFLALRRAALPACGRLASAALIGKLDTTPRRDGWQVAEAMPGREIFIPNAKRHSKSGVALVTGLPNALHRAFGSGLF
jgi:hypothetical protein